VIWLRSHSSEPFASAFIARFRISLHTETQATKDGPSLPSSASKI
jgi:hypothetical protein